MPRSARRQTWPAHRCHRRALARLTRSRERSESGPLRAPRRHRAPAVRRATRRRGPAAGGRHAAAPRPVDAHRRPLPRPPRRGGRHRGAPVVERDDGHARRLRVRRTPHAAPDDRCDPWRGHRHDRHRAAPRVQSSRLRAARRVPRLAGVRGVRRDREVHRPGDPRLRLPVPRDEAHRRRDGAAQAERALRRPVRCSRRAAAPASAARGRVQRARAVERGDHWHRAQLGDERAAEPGWRDADHLRRERRDGRDRAHRRRRRERGGPPRGGGARDLQGRRGAHLPAAERVLRRSRAADDRRSGPPDRERAFPVQPARRAPVPAVHPLRGRPLHPAHPGHRPPRARGDVPEPERARHARRRARPGGPRGPPDGRRRAPVAARGDHRLRARRRPAHARGHPARRSHRPSRGGHQAVRGEARREGPSPRSSPSASRRSCSRS